ncbi:hypothetical protein ACIA8R_35070 [Nonomuraea sp. NPDC051191]|uniref:hypothetical protein n=1 Tax=Nonomuraea sp. NPDC051191 TaxID=3364372 RepID=UPI0037B48E3C
MNDKDDSSRERHPELVAVRRAYEKADAALQDIGDAEQAYQMATQLADCLRELADAAALARAKSAARLRRSGNLSIAGLATKLGLSKSRAGQLLRAASECMEGKTNGNHR